MQPNLVRFVPASSCPQANFRAGGWGRPSANSHRMLGFPAMAIAAGRASGGWILLLDTFQLGDNRRLSGGCKLLGGWQSGLRLLTTVKFLPFPALIAADLVPRHKYQHRK